MEYHYTAVSGTTKTLPTIHCPISFCDSPKLSFQLSGPGGAVCVYGTRGQYSCNLSFGGSFCVAKGRVVGGKNVKIEADGRTVVRCKSSSDY
jgi:hypothetical protein